VIAGCARCGADDLDSHHSGAGEWLLHRAGAGRRTVDSAGQRLEALYQAAEVVHQAPENVDERSRSGQTTAEADGAQAPAAAEQEVWILPVSLEGGCAEESMGGFGGEQALEDGAGVLAAFGTVNLPA
jgi:hypothetical protein